MSEAEGKSGSESDPIHASLTSKRQTRPLQRSAPTLPARGLVVTGNVENKVNELSGTRSILIGATTGVTQDEQSTAAIHEVDDGEASNAGDVYDATSPAMLSERWLVETPPA